MKLQQTSVSNINKQNRSSFSQTDFSKCIICQKVKSDRNRKRRYEDLDDLTTDTASSSIINAAEERGDGRILLAIRGKTVKELVAMEVKYHRTC